MKTVWICSLLVALCGCGVKGDPVPPQSPTELGRGQPMYRRATRKVDLKPQAGKEESDPAENLEDEAAEKRERE